MAAVRLSPSRRIPQLTGRVTDEAGLLTPADRADLEASSPRSRKPRPTSSPSSRSNRCRAIRSRTTAISSAAHWGIGQKGKDNGVLLIVAPNDHKVRIEVGRRLEPIITDAMIEHHHRQRDPSGVPPRRLRRPASRPACATSRMCFSATRKPSRSVRKARAGHNSPDTMQVILLIFWIRIVFYILWMPFIAPRRPRSKPALPGAAGPAAPSSSRAAPAAGAAAGRAAAMAAGRLVGRRRRFRRRRLLGKLVRMRARGEVEMSLILRRRGAARLRRDHAGRAQDLGRDRRCRRRAQRHLLLCSPTDRSACRVCSCPGC